MSTPNIPGFIDAQARIRSQLGVDAIFHVPSEPTWDPAEPLDPETGKPYDPFAEPTSGGDDVLVTKRVGLISSLVTGSVPRDDVVASPIGPISSSDIALDVDVADYEDIKSARRVTVLDRRYDIEEIRPDGIANQTVRYFVYAQKL